MPARGTGCCIWQASDCHQLANFAEQREHPRNVDAISTSDKSILLAFSIDPICWFLAEQRPRALCRLINHFSRWPVPRGHCLGETAVVS